MSLVIDALLLSLANTTFVHVLFPPTRFLVLLCTMFSMSGPDQDDFVGACTYLRYKASDIQPRSK